MICGNEDTEYDEESFSPEPEFSVICLVLAITAQRPWVRKHFDVQMRSQMENWIDLFS